MSATITNVYEFRGMNADDMKLAYKKLVKRLHPDVNKSDTATRDMQILNAEFAHYQAVAQRDFVYNAKVQENPDNKQYYHDMYNNDTFVNSLASGIAYLINHGIFTSATFDVEIIGIFLWVFNVGKTDTTIHTILRNAGFRFKMKKDEVTGEFIPAWYFTPQYKRIATKTSKQDNERKYGYSKVYGNRGIASGD